MGEGVDLRFHRDERLCKRKDFLAAYRRGRKILGAYLVLYIAPNARPSSRLGTTVSRKIGKSVVRNRLKRRLREIFRASKGTIQPPCDLVVNVKRTAPAASYEELRADLLAALERWKQEPGE